VTHDQDQYKYASRIIRMIDGGIVSDEINKHSEEILLDFIKKR
jgi:ABC-type lipoprotein export system ATPase subunit